MGGSSHWDKTVTRGFHGFLYFPPPGRMGLSSPNRPPPMPLLVALDECNCALTKIERLAQIALNHPGIREGALALILLQCQETDTHVGELNSD
jgi:hypothetical protein